MPSARQTSSRIDVPCLVIGASGFIGGAFVRALQCEGTLVIGTSHQRAVRGLEPLELTDQAAVTRLIHRVRPRGVVLPAAFSNVEGCEQEPDRAGQVNVQGVRHVADVCRELDIPLVFFSSEYVFDGTAGPYDETAVPNPVNVYGRTKLEAEQCIQRLLKQFLIIRTTVVFGYDPYSKNTAMSLLKRVGQVEALRCPTDQMTTPTHVEDLVRLTRSLMARQARGIYHVVGRDWVSRYELARRLTRACGFDERLVVPVTSEELGQRARRPLTAGLTTHKLTEFTGQVPWSLGQAVERFRDQWSEAGTSHAETGRRSSREVEKRCSSF